MSNDTRRKARRTLPMIAAIVVVLFPLCYSVASFVLASGEGEGVPFLAEPADGDACALGKSTAYMRFHHMDLLKEMRDEEVRAGGERQVELADCRECHPNRAEFCNKCHEAVNLEPDCFQCHYYPEVYTPEMTRTDFIAVPEEGGKGGRR